MKKIHSASWLINWQARLRFLALTFLGLAIALMLNFPLWTLAQTANNDITNPSTAKSTSEIAPILKPTTAIQEPESPPTPPFSNEIRGIWLTNVDSDVLFSTQRLERAIGRLKRLNFNTVYPTVWNGGYTLYPSKVAQKYFGIEVDPLPDFRDRDMLAEAIKFGHEQNLAVIPWFEYGLMTEEKSAIALKHPEWITKRQDGSEVFLYGENDEHRLVWLNPAHPEVQKFLTELIVEVVKKYDIDGIQLDDHFGMPVELGYDNYTVDLYQRSHFGRLPPADVNDPEWMRWRSSYVSGLMRKITNAVRSIKPNCLISLSPNPREFSYTKYLQDWYSWVYAGWLDELIVQVYRTDIDGYISELSRPEWQDIRQRIPVAVGILTGLRIQNVDMRQIKGQVRIARELSFDGFSFFFYESLGRRDSSFESLLFNPASRPESRNIASSRG